MVVLVGRHLEDHLVVDLEDEPARQALLLERVVERHERHLEDVGGEALDAGVHGLPLARLADAEVRRRQLGDGPAATEQRLGVAALAGLGHGALHVGAHRRERHEVGVEDLGRLGHLDAQALRQAVRLHAVGEAVADHLRLGPLLVGDRVGRHAEHPRRGGGVDVVAARRTPPRGRGRRPGARCTAARSGCSRRRAARSRRPARTPAGRRDPRRSGPGCCAGSARRSCSRPVRATVWLNVAWMRPSDGSISARRPSP